VNPSARNEIFSHTESLWILGIGGTASKKPVSPLVEMVDWYNNQLIAKSLLKKTIPLSFSSQVLLATSGLLPVSRLIVFSLGEGPLKEDAKTVCEELNKLLEGLNESRPWIIFPATLESDFSRNFDKSRTKFQRLAEATYTAG
jgi:hypothetical protein